MSYNEFQDIIKEAFPEVTPGQLEQFRRMEELYRECKIPYFFAIFSTFFISLVSNCST